MIKEIFNYIFKIIFKMIFKMIIFLFRYIEFQKRKDLTKTIDKNKINQYDDL